MYLFNKILKIALIQPTIKADIINSRGSIKEPFPSDFSNEEKALINLVKSMTMTSHERLVALSRAIDYISENHIEGDVVECGVWRGGSMALAARKLVLLKEQDRKLFLFDTFEGMSAPTEADRSATNNIAARTQLEHTDKYEGDNVWCYSTLEEVKSNLEKSSYPSENIFYFKGKVEVTLPEKKINKIALLRLDTDWYESTKHELETLYDHVVPGGVIIIDDYGHWSGAKKAVDEFIEKRNLAIFLNRIDYTGRLAIKI